mgnify:CR=1 FL=1
MYYKLSHFYKRDVSFAYSEEQNPINWLDFRSGEKINVKTPLVFKVDKLDDYIHTFDILPTIGVPLVSYKFKELFLHLSDSMEIEFLPTNIIDTNGNNNDAFFALNILHLVPCLDKEKSIFEIDSDGYYSIKKWFVNPQELKSYSIVRMKEHSSYIIVSEEFKDICDRKKLKGFKFTEEGYSIWK